MQNNLKTLCRLNAHLGRVLPSFLLATCGLALGGEVHVPKVAEPQEPYQPNVP